MHAHHRMPRPGGFPPWIAGLAFMLFIGGLISSAQAASLAIAQAVLDGNGQLRIEGATDSGAPVELYDLAGRRLWSGPSGNFSASVDARQRGGPVCAVRAKSGAASALKRVAGAPADCAKAPLCQIVSPAEGYQAQARQEVSFTATAALKDKKAWPLRMEWDFAGGALGQAIPGTNPTLYQRPDGLKAKTRFVRDNARYRVRFTVWDQQNRYCEDSVLVTVGTPPAGLPDLSPLVQAARDTAPTPGSPLSGKQDELVVLPYAENTVLGTGDYRYLPNVNVIHAQGAFGVMNAQVYRKDRLPVVVGDDAVALRYSAASNPDDPVGADSINATSQNWPLQADIRQPTPLLDAQIAKTDAWETWVRPESEPRTATYGSFGWAMSLPWWTWWPGDDFVTPDLWPDEGFRIWPAGFNYPNPPGRMMPGRDQPYASNQPQDFTAYLPEEKTHTARAIPTTDIDDAGRVNPFPLLRVQAVDKAGGKTLAATDAVLATGRDLHCRGCHAKGEIGANDRLDWNQFRDAYHSSPFYGKDCRWFISCDVDFRTPTFYPSVDVKGQPSTSLFDEEYAANRNLAELHDFYDNTPMRFMYQGQPDAVGVWLDVPEPCDSCHRSRVNAEVGYNFGVFTGQNPGDENRAPSLSQVSHLWHAQLQKDPAHSGDILRETGGRPLRWDFAQGPNPNTLFPEVDAQGHSLPMEQNCLQCHAGHREPLYRDRMYTAGVTCYDCHGGMAAVGQAHLKPKQGPEGHKTRVEWYEQPDCGSCHTGNANQGKDSQGGFFSAGVLKRAFAADDPSATPLPAKTQRFAVQPGHPLETTEDNWLPVGYRTDTLTLSAPLYRRSRDTHGDVACAACHGGAHEVWPNRDPKANDNLTAIELQGHTGSILECAVCHAADAFRLQGDLDGGTYSGDAKAGILGGPHNLHPVNDAYWWKSAEGDVANQDGAKYGGWHNNYAQKPGKDGEDQCAACHGNDHKGTRLSKTPVDRVFDFSGFDFAKLKAAGFKSKVVKVTAGAEIGCDTCHSIQTSCIGSPAGARCGVASAFVPVQANRNPVITSRLPSRDVVIGQPWNYQVAATDPDGDSLAYSLSLKPDALSISEAGLIASDWPASLLSGKGGDLFKVPFTVTVKDGKGGYATQTVTLRLKCPTGQRWSEDPATSTWHCAG
jgi:hypothetical protein